ncbi:putative signal peptide and transmembrane protein [Rhodopirellula islandica]|uniref:Signal peptide and transmembrane protein n=1 Tax=Rhodopirellula islandica TaxID=595434 RepID=A0A0J1EKU6_RHOIS|nr:putative signal peptide and transmembrane protein [Rhodopirellula islandica]
MTVQYTVDDGLGGVSTFSDLEVESAVLGADYFTITQVGGQVEVIPVNRVVRFSCQP